MAAAMNFMICELYLNKALIFRKKKKRNREKKVLGHRTWLKPKHGNEDIYNVIWSSVLLKQK